MNNNIKEAKFNKKVILKLVFNIMLVFGLARTITGPLIPVFSEEFKLGYDQMGLIFFVGVFSGMIAVIILGRLSDKFGRKLIINISIVILLAGIIGILFSRSIIPFIISYCVISFSFGGLETGITTGAAEFEEENSSSILIRLFKFESSGSFIGPLLLFLILYFSLQWRILFALLLIPFCILFILFLRLYYPKKVFKSESNKIKITDIINSVTLTGSAVLIFANGVIVNFGVWLTTYFLAFNVRVAFSSIAVSLYWLSIFIGRLITQKLLIKIDEKKFLIAISFAAIIDLAIISFSGNLIVKAVFSFLLGLIVSGIYPILFSIIFSTNPKVIGGIFSFLGFVGYGTIMLFQLITGYFAENFGKETIIYIQLTSSVLCFIFVLILVRFKIKRDSIKI